VQKPQGQTFADWYRKGFASLITSEESKGEVKALIRKPRTIAFVFGKDGPYLHDEGGGFRQDRMSKEDSIPGRSTH